MISTVSFTETWKVLKLELELELKLQLRLEHQREHVQYILLEPEKIGLQFKVKIAERLKGFLTLIFTLKVTVDLS